MKQFDMNGKVALIAGASSGIGRASAIILARNGAKVVIAARREERLQELQREIVTTGGICEYVVCDVTKEEDCQKAVKKCEKCFGKLNILVNSAGTSGSTGFDSGLTSEFDTDNLHHVMDVDFFGVFYMIKYAYPACERAGEGSIINISSIAALKAAGPLVYTAAKGAIKSMTRSLGKSLGPKNIRINSIYPGLIETEMTAPGLANSEFLESHKKKSPLGKIGQPEDIANCVLYLASDASAFVTGQDFVIDGGTTC